MTAIVVPLEPCWHPDGCDAKRKRDGWACAYCRLDGQRAVLDQAVAVAEHPGYDIPPGPRVWVES